MFPHITSLGSVAFLAGIVLLFAGVEVHAVHANELENPAKQFPASMFLAMAVVFVLFTLGSLAVATVIPAAEISLTAGLMQAFKDLLDKLKMGFLTPIIGLLTAFGAIGGVMSWISGHDHNPVLGDVSPDVCGCNQTANYAAESATII